MKFIRLILLFLILTLAGCAPTHKYQGNNIPLLSSDKFPSYSVNSPIIEGVEVKFPQGSGKARLSIDITMSKSSKSATMYQYANWDWNIKYENNKIVNDHAFDIYANALYYKSQKEVKNLKKHTKMEINCIHDTNGKEISMDVKISDKDNKFTEDELDKLKQAMSAQINQQLTDIGRTVKTGDILRDVSIDFSQIKTISEADKRQSNIPEIVKGWGTYRGKKVVVTEYIWEDRIDWSNSILEIRGKGYNLYDGESFNRVLGKAIFYANIFSSKEGTITMIMDTGFYTRAY